MAFRSWLWSRTGAPGYLQFNDKQHTPTGEAHAFDPVGVSDSEQEISAARAGLGLRPGGVSPQP